MLDLELAIFRQFGRLCFPVDGRLLYDEACLDSECKYIKTVFSRKNWWEVSPPKNMSFRSDLFHFFSAEALLYYFPAFMLEILRSYEAADVLVDRFLELILDGVVGEDGDPNEFFKVKGLAFTFGQFITVMNFLRYIAYNYDDDEAFDILAMLGCD